MTPEKKVPLHKRPIPVWIWPILLATLAPAAFLLYPVERLSVFVACGTVGGLFVFLPDAIKMVRSETSKRQRLVSAAFRVGLTYVLFCAVLSLICVSVILVFLAALLWLADPEQRVAEGYILAPVVVLTGGLLLFSFRLHFRVLYGLTEVLGGLMLASHHAHAIPAARPEFYLVLVTAGAFLVVRGLDNIHQGVAGSARDKLVSWLRETRERPSERGPEQAQRSRDR